MFLMVREAASPLIQSSAGAAGLMEPTMFWSIQSDQRHNKDQVNGGMCNAHITTLWLQPHMGKTSMNFGELISALHRHTLCSHLMTLLHCLCLTPFSCQASFSF